MQEEDLLEPDTNLYIDDLSEHLSSQPISALNRPFATPRKKLEDLKEGKEHSTQSDRNAIDAFEVNANIPVSKRSAEPSIDLNKKSRPHELPALTKPTTHEQQEPGQSSPLDPLHTLRVRNQSRSLQDDTSSLRSELSSVASSSKSRACFICQKPSAFDADGLVRCSKCRKPYHKGCHKPIISEEVGNAWQCYRCIRKERAGRPSSASQHLSVPRKSPNAPIYADEPPTKKLKLDQTGKKDRPFAMRVAREIDEGQITFATPAAPKLAHEDPSIGVSPEIAETPDLSLITSKADNTQATPPSKRGSPQSSATKSVPGSSQKSYLVADRPAISYDGLIGMALLQAPDHRLQATGVKKWISENIPGYAMGRGHWETGVTAILSMECKGQDAKLEKQDWRQGDPGKGVCSWAIRKGYEKFFRPWNPVKENMAAETVEVVDEEAKDIANHPTIGDEQQAAADVEMQDAEEVARSALVDKSTLPSSVRDQVSTSVNPTFMRLQADDESLVAGTRDTSPEIPLAARREKGHANMGSPTADRPSKTKLKSNAAHKSARALVKGPGEPQPGTPTPAPKLHARSDNDDSRASASNAKSQAPVNEELSRALANSEGPAITYDPPNNELTHSPTFPRALPPPNSANNKTQALDHHINSLDNIVTFQTYGCKSLFKTYPELDPKTTTTNGPTLDEIRARPTRKQIFGKNAMISRLGTGPSDEKMAIIRTALHRAPLCDANGVERGDSHDSEASVPGATAWNKVDGFGEPEEFDNLDDLLGIPRTVLPIIHDGQLVFRDAGKSVMGRMARAKVFYRIGHEAKGQ